MELRTAELGKALGGAGLRRESISKVLDTLKLRCTLPIHVKSLNVKFDKKWCIGRTPQIFWTD